MPPRPHRGGYVNSSAAVKALSDYCVTSSNAVELIKSLPVDDKVIFAPDRFLGDYVMRETGRDMLLWQGSCEIHELFSADKIADLQAEYPRAVTLVHLSARKLFGSGRCHR